MLKYLPSSKSYIAHLALLTMHVLINHMHISQSCMCPKCSSIATAEPTNPPTTLLQEPPQHSSALHLPIS